MMELQCSPHTVTFTAVGVDERVTKVPAASYLTAGDVELRRL